MTPKIPWTHTDPQKWHFPKEDRRGLFICVSGHSWDTKNEKISKYLFFSGLTYFLTFSASTKQIVYILIIVTCCVCILRSITLHNYESVQANDTQRNLIKNETAKWRNISLIKKRNISLNITFNEKNVIFSEMNKKPNYFAKYQFQ